MMGDWLKLKKIHFLKKSLMTFHLSRDSWINRNFREALHPVGEVGACSQITHSCATGTDHETAITCHYVEQKQTGSMGRSRKRLKVSVCVGGDCSTLQ